MALITINGARTNVTATGEDVVTVVQNATNLNQLSDVTTNGISTGEILVYNALDSQWHNTDTIDGPLTVNGDLTLDLNSVFTADNVSVYTDSGNTRYTYNFSWEQFGSQFNGTAKFSAVKLPGTVVAKGWYTENDHLFWRLIAQDTGTGDDGSHNTTMYMVGGFNEIVSTDLGSNLTDLKYICDNFRFQANNIEYTDLNEWIFNADLSRLKLNGTPTLTTRIPHDVVGDSTLEIRRDNSSGGTSFDQDTGIYMRFLLADEDQTVLYNPGSIKAVYHGGIDPNAENQMAMLLNDDTGTQQNNFTLRETHGHTAQPLAMGEFTVATLPDLSSAGQNGYMTYCSDGDAGNPCMVFWSGTGWFKVHDPATAPSAT